MTTNMTNEELAFIIENFTQIRSEKLISGINEYYFNIAKYAKAGKSSGVDRKSIRINVLKINDIKSKLDGFDNCISELESLSKKDFATLLSLTPTHKNNLANEGALIWHKNIQNNKDINSHLLATNKRSFDNLITRLIEKLELVKIWKSQINCQS